MVPIFPELSPTTTMRIEASFDGTGNSAGMAPSLLSGNEHLCRRRRTDAEKEAL